MMRIQIDYTRRFLSKYKKLRDKRPQVESLLRNAMILLMEDLGPASLKVHKLSGKLEGYWSFSISYDLRVVFERSKDSIVFIDIGTHDQVY